MASVIPAALMRLMPLLRLPDERNAWEWTPDGLRNAQSGRGFPLCGGVLDMLGDQFRPTFVQRLLDTRITAAMYDYTRDLGLRLLTDVKSFAEEVAMIERRLAINDGSYLLDLACGQGNFTVAWADRVGEAGLVVGLDISRAMLRRAAHRVHRRSLSNVALVRGDALELPFDDDVFDTVNCSGGFHQLPDLPRALREIARVLKPGGRLAASTFARAADSSKAMSEKTQGIHFVDLTALADTIESAGFTDYHFQLGRGAWGYLWAQRSEQPNE